MGKGAKPQMSALFWRWFDERRKQPEFDLSDSGVASKAKIAQSVISKARSGAQPIGYEALGKIADALQTPRMTVWALAGLVDPKEALTPEQAALNAMFDELSEMDREEVLAGIRVRVRRGKRHERETP
jgi:hypothetical protein